MADAPQPPDAAPADPSASTPDAPDRPRMPPRAARLSQLKPPTSPPVTKAPVAPAAAPPPPPPAASPPPSPPVAAAPPAVAPEHTSTPAAVAPPVVASEQPSPPHPPGAYAAKPSADVLADVNALAAAIQAESNFTEGRESGFARPAQALGADVDASPARRPATPRTAAPSAVPSLNASTSSTPTRSGAVHFRPLTDSLATRSVLFSTIGLPLFFFPILSLLGIGSAMIALRRIAASDGQLVGRRSALLGLILGVIGVAAGATLIALFMLDVI